MNPAEPLGFVAEPSMETEKDVQIPKATGNISIDACEDDSTVEPVIKIEEPSPKNLEDDKVEELEENLSVCTAKMSIEELINMDNISAFNLYLGPELERLSNSSSCNINSDNEDSDAFTISSQASNSPVKDPSKAVEIDYANLDRFGFIVLGDEEKYPPGSEEESKIRKEQYTQS